MKERKKGTHTHPYIYKKRRERQQKKDGTEGKNKTEKSQYK
jgi:hypothetical protein